MAKRNKRQRGFTTLELAIAGFISAGLALAGLNLIVTSMNIKNELDARVRTNRAARLAMVTLTDGGLSTAPGTDGTTLAHGIRGRAGAPTVTLEDGEVMQFVTNGITVTGQRNSGIVVQCRGINDPTPACDGTVASVTLDGPIPEAPEFNDVNRSIRNQTVEMRIAVQDPWAAARGDLRVERYGGIVQYIATEGEGTQGNANASIDDKPVGAKNLPESTEPKAQEDESLFFRLFGR